MTIAEIHANHRAAEGDVQRLVLELGHATQRQERAKAQADAADAGVLARIHAPQLPPTAHLSDTSNPEDPLIAAFLLGWNEQDGMMRAAQPAAGVREALDRNDWDEALRLQLRDAQPGVEVSART